MASALFARAAGDAQLQSELPAAAVAATREPEETRNSPPTPPAIAVSPAPAASGPVPPGAAGSPVVPRQAPPVDEPAIHATIRAYAAAYSALDADAVRRVFPSVNEQALRRAFGGLRSQAVGIEGEQVALNGDTATVSCTLVTLAVGQIGASTPRRDSRRVTFTLAKRGGAWIIVDRR
jgi:ketosteroid isomerase-like protein